MGTADELRAKRCQPCEGGVPPVPRKQAEELLCELEHWTLAGRGKRIRRELIFDDFMEAVNFINQVAELAENEGHHPDLHLSNYRHLTIELTTHAIRGLSENDFILAAKIDELADEEGVGESPA